MMPSLMLPALSLMLLTFVSALPAAERIEKERREVQWAKRVVTDFFDASAASDRPNVMGLLSSEYAKQIEKWDTSGQILGLRSPTIKSHEIAPDRREVIFSGLVNYKEFFGQGEREATFVVRVAKEQSGIWSIRYVRVRTEESRPAATAPPGEKKGTTEPR